MWEGGGEAYIICVSSPITAVKLGAVRIDPRVLVKYKGKLLWVSPGRLVSWLWLKYGWTSTVEKFVTSIQCRWGKCWGFGGNQFVSLFLVSASCPREKSPHVVSNIAARCQRVFFSWRNKPLVLFLQVLLLPKNTATTKSKRLRWWHSWLCRDRVQSPAVSCFFSLLWGWVEMVGRVGGNYNDCHRDCHDVTEW